MTETRVQIGNVDYFTVHRLAPGNEKGTPPILLIHALMANHHMWDSTATALNKAGYNTVQIDNIGHGESTAPTSFESSVEHPAFHFDDMTRHFRSVVKTVTGQQKVEAVIGCSIGGILTLRYGLLFPDEIQNCIVCCDAPSASSAPAAIPMWGERIEQLKKDVAEGTEVLANLTAARWVPGDDKQSEIARNQARDLTRTCTLDGYRICADGCRSYDYQPLLGGMKVKTLVLAGREDSSIGPPEVTEGIAKAIPGAALVWMENTGHLPPLHRPQEFESIALDFLKKPTHVEAEL